MDYRQLTPDHSVAPQVTPEDIPAIVAAGFRTLICNRPDSEVVEHVRAENMRAAAEAAGLTFVENPLSQGDLSPLRIQQQKEAMDALDGPSLAYCASGTRSAILWLCASAGSASADDLLEIVERAGYRLDAVRPMLETLQAGDTDLP